MATVVVHCRQHDVYSRFIESVQLRSEIRTSREIFACELLHTVVHILSAQVFRHHAGGVIVVLELKDPRVSFTDRLLNPKTSYVDMTNPAKAAPTHKMLPRCCIGTQSYPCVRREIVKH